MPSVSDLDDLAIDKIIRLLSDQDLRSFHQVNRAWKSALESRSADNKRRLDLVRNIRQNKENICDGSKDDPAPVITRVKRDTPSDIKPGSLLLMECTNMIQKATDNTTENEIILTPTSRFPLFQSFEEAEKSLKAGQKLFQCRRCKGPVPSPILPNPRDEEELERIKGPNHKIEATRCRLFSRMGMVTPTDNEKFRERKKSKTPLSLMPPPLSPLDIPTTTALGERMSKSLVISGGDWSPISQNVEQIDECRNASASSDGIDLQISRLSDASSINCKLNFTNTSFNSPFSPFSIVSLDLESVFESSSISGDELIEDVKPNYGFKKSAVFANLILSPVPGKYHGESIFTNSNLTPQTTQEDLMKQITLSNSTGSTSNNNLVLCEHDNNDIEPSTYKCHNIYDVKGMHEMSLIVNDRESPSGTNVPDSCSIQYPSLIFEGSQSKSTSDYFSGRSSVLRDGSSKSYFPEISACRLELANTSFNNSVKNKSKSRSLGNVIDINESQLSPFEPNQSSVSCPNLNESFILECPNPNCSYRFCSTCYMAEHAGRSCRIIESESFEDLNESVLKSIWNVSQKKDKTGEINGKGRGKSKTSQGKNKKSLRRIAKL